MPNIVPLHEAVNVEFVGLGAKAISELNSSIWEEVYSEEGFEDDVFGGAQSTAIRLFPELS
ncbi:MAG: hypothetical protein QM710_06380 [Flavobacterium sp.]